MIVPDANLLLYAYDEESSRHHAARRWWESCLSGSESVGLTHPTLFAFLRVSTLASAFKNPLTLPQASTEVGAWMNRRVARVLTPGPNHIEHVLTLLETAGSAGGNLVTDAQIAALAIAHRGTVHTADHDFRRFPKLDFLYPLDDKF